MPGALVRNPYLHHSTPEFKAKRLRQLLWATQIALVLAALISLWSGRTIDTWIATTAITLNVIPFYWTHKGRVELAATALLLGMTITMSIAICMGAGLRAPGMLALPAILTYAVLLGSQRLFYGLIAWFLIFTLGITSLNVTGIYIHQVPPVTWATGANTFIVLILLSLSAHLFAQDLRALLRRLNDEIRRTRESRAQIQRLAQHDSLTGLPKRELAESRFIQDLARAKREGSQVTLMYIDLDDFRNINDSLGHGTGDRVLYEISRRLKSCIRISDTLCRYGGDEFILILPQIPQAIDVAKVAQKILSALALPWECEGSEIICTGSIGIATGPNDADDFTTLLKKADMALRKAQEAGRNTYRSFDPQMNRDMREHIETLADMRKALVENQFELHFQPQVELSSGRIFGAEALVRWRHPTRGLVPPLDFIPLAEKSGLIVDLGAWVLREACQRCAEWNRIGLDALTVAVNISAVQCKRGTLEQVVLEALQHSGLAPEFLELELTESLLIDDNDRLRDTLRNLKKMGVRFSIDDFGTGYSNLGYLKKFQMDALKIDQSFVRNLRANTQDQTIVTAILQMSQGLGVHNIAEGVEDQGVAEMLTAMKCSYGQGYYWSKPLPNEDFVAFALAAQIHPKHPS